ncbi:hypothetical protein [Xanthocytophaga agilis]|uniref:Lipoprotein n=1 Tax=Xanthocytophaga agilis TaxID=3048010 RepID=A0AAE3UIP0_9BACT|nr:hypothetical protein [Xanthocytophaga agilis]MDJ1503958.1 hypothetical protein [Xanthocytophaga agilis]
MNKIIIVALLMVQIILCSCDNIQTKKEAAIASIHYDTVNFGSYYNVPMDSAFFFSIKDTKNTELSDFTVDSAYVITVSLKGKQDIPFRLISLNKNVEVKPIQTNENKYQLNIQQRVPTADKYYAKLAVIPPDSTRYIFRNRFWLDSTKSKFEEGTMEVDTICKLTYKINADK